MPLFMSNAVSKLGRTIIKGILRQCGSGNHEECKHIYVSQTILVCTCSCHTEKTQGQVVVTEDKSGFSVGWESD